MDAASSFFDSALHSKIVISTSTTRMILTFVITFSIVFIVLYMGLSRRNPPVKKDSKPVQYELKLLLPDVLGRDLYIYDVASLVQLRVNDIQRRIFSVCDSKIVLFHVNQPIVSLHMISTEPISRVVIRSATGSIVYDYIA
jgi:hypothetical protein